jgi:uncharacterized lipoprotein YddW (UPF0748 family)
MVGNNYDPALPEVQNHLIAVVDEVVRNYDIDAIHFDDLSQYRAKTLMILHPLKNMVEE